jgi:guanylate kinase
LSLGSTLHGRPCIPITIDGRLVTRLARWSQVRESGLRAIFVFVAPPSIEELEKRLRGRGTETEEAVQKRLAGAKDEIARCEADSSVAHSLHKQAWRHTRRLCRTTIEQPS